MASIAASMRWLVPSTARQTTCRAMATIHVPRSFSSFQPLRAELNKNDQGLPQIQEMPQIPAMGRREIPEGNPDQLMEKDWEFDDISSAAHAELERHREARQYARIAAYEMPLLASIITHNFSQKLCSSCLLIS